MTTPGAREACPQRGGEQPHKLRGSRFGGAFCLRCDKSFPLFHMHYKQLCDCQTTESETET